MALFWKRRPRRVRRRGRQSKSVLRQLLYGTLTIGIVAGLGYGVWYVTRLPVFTISDIVVSGGETIDHELVRTRADEVLDGAYALLIPRRFTYLYPKEHLLSELATIPRVQSVEIHTESRTQLLISLQEYTPYALWCGESIPEEDVQTGDCVFLSEGGYAFGEAPPLRGGAFIRYMFEGRMPEAGVQPILPYEIKRIELFMEALETLGFRISSVDRTSAGDEQYRLVGGGMLLVSPELSAEETFQNLQSVLSSDEFSDLEPGNFSYIDLRFGNRVFVNEEAPPPTREPVEETVSDDLPDTE